MIATRLILRLVLSGALALMLISVAGALATANTVAPSGADDLRTAITANSLKPPECAALNLTNLIVVSGTVNGGNGSSLILGSAGADNINGQGGSDCILGGGGNDTLRGGAGTEVLIGGPGADTLNGGGGSDICYGYNASISGGGIDTFSSCETRYP